VPNVAVRDYSNAQYEPFPPFLYPTPRAILRGRNGGLIRAPIITENDGFSPLQAGFAAAERMSERTPSQRRMRARIARLAGAFQCSGVAVAVVSDHPGVELGMPDVLTAARIITDYYGLVVQFLYPFCNGASSMCQHEKVYLKRLTGLANRLPHLQTHVTLKYLMPVFCNKYKVILYLIYGMIAVPIVHPRRLISCKGFVSQINLIA